MDACRVCQKEFVATPKMAAKSDFICKQCKSIRAKEYRAKKKAEGNPIVKAQMPIEWRRNYNKEYFSKPEVKAKRAEQMKKSQAADSPNRQKHEARWKVHRAIESGKLVRMPCEVCGSTERIHAHHDDYEKPLEVRWLCHTHHIEHHLNAKLEESHD